MVIGNDTVVPGSPEVEPIARDTVGCANAAGNAAMASKNRARNFSDMNERPLVLIKQEKRQKRNVAIKMVF
jgi:hypothetical protein